MADNNNTVVDYVAKDFNSIVDALISYANVNYGPGTSANRLWTNFNQDSFSRNWLEIVAYVTDLLFFYFDVQATQAYLQTATIRSAVYNIAKQFGFEPASATSASGNISLTFTNNTASVINTALPRGFRFVDAAGQEYFLTTQLNASIPANSTSTYTSSVLQGIIKTESFTAFGIQNEEFVVIGPNVIKDTTNSNIDDISPQVTVNGNAYTLVSSFLRFNAQDSAPVIDSLGNVIGGGGRVFTLDEKPDGRPFIKFGDGIFGRKLNPSDSVVVIYRTGGGSSGNLVTGSTISPKDSNPYLTNVVINGDFSGGADQQTIEQLRELIPASLRTLERAVAKQDYSDILIANFPEVFTASTETNYDDPGIDINIYVVPTGAGIAKISDNSLLLSRLSEFLDRRKMVTVQYSIQDAFGVDILISLEVFITNTSSKAAIRSAIITALQDYFNLTTGGTDGNGVGFAEPILLKDITEVIKNIPGIDRFEIKKLTYRPRVVESPVGLLTTYNVSEVSLYPTVHEIEWLIGASGIQTEVVETNFSNTQLVPFAYNSTTGEVAYNQSVNLTAVAPGDTFIDSALAEFPILGVDAKLYKIYIAEALTVNTTVPTNANHGSVQNGETTYNSYKVFKKILATTTNLSVNSITDSNLDLTVFKGSASSVTTKILLDNNNVYIMNQLASGAYLLQDSAGNIWEIVSNSANTIAVGSFAINDAGITAVSAGDYKIIQNLIGKELLFQTNIFTILYNTENTFYSIGALFNQIGTIGDRFEISETQTNLGNMGVDVNLIAFNSTTKELKLNGSPNLLGINSHYVLSDNAGQILNVVGVDNRTSSSENFVSTLVPTNSDSYILKDTGLGSQYAQSFTIGTTDTYTVISLYMKRMGNTAGYLSARIVEDDGTGLPSSTVVATADYVTVGSLPKDSVFGSLIKVEDKVHVTTNDSLNSQGFEKVVFGFSTSPILTAATKYHLIVTGDVTYNSSFSFSQTPILTIPSDVFYTYTPSTGVIEYGGNTGSINFTAIQPGNYFEDGSGNYYTILSVDDQNKKLTIVAGASIIGDYDKGDIYKFDAVFISVDTTNTYTSGDFSRYDGSTWANHSLGFPVNLLPAATDAYFQVEGPKSLKIDSNLTPSLGAGASLSVRYYDDNNELSFVLGLSGGYVTSASDVNAFGKGTVGTTGNSKVDNFVFRTSRYADDIVSLRLNEIPQIQQSDIVLNIFGGVA